jgi:hypothetical protein
MTPERKIKLVVAAAALAALRGELRGQVSFSIDLTKGQSAISPFIYGENTNGSAGVANAGLNQSPYNTMNLAFERWGGDRLTAYNWTNNASNAGSDYQYESDNFLGGGSTPGGAAIPFLQAGQAAGAQALITVPINGYVAADESGPVNPAILPQNSPHFVPEYPTAAQDPAPAANHVYQDGYVRMAEANFAATATAPLAFELDNEPDIWSATHPEVHPNKVTYAELVQKTIAYSTMIKQVDPKALVYGWASYGWDGYLSLNQAPDAAANGNFLNYYLSNIASASASAGVRLLDALDLHWYTVATGANAQGVQTRVTSDDTSPGVVAARLQAPRSLWDPTYTETGTITATGTGPIQLIPRTMAQINQYYPGTKLSFTEYNYGAGADISGGLAEADVLGIFGKYGVYSTSEEEITSVNDSYIHAAFRLYRNYDGHDATFGDTEVQATNSDTVNTSVYASVDSTNSKHLSVVAINKESQSVTATVSLADGPSYKTAAVYTLTSASAAPVFAGDISVAGAGSFTYAMPAYSASMISFFVPGQTVGTWNQSGGGTWSSLTAWTGAPAQSAGDTANFTSAITASSTVSLTSNFSVGTINFNNAKSYTLAAGGGGVLTMDNGTSSAAITDSGGSHFITAPVVLNSPTTVTVVNAGTSVTISGAISGSGGLTVAGSGSVILGGSNSFQGGVSVTGNLSVTAAAALPSAGGLTIQNGAKAALTSGIGAVTVTSLAIAGSGSLDLANNHLLINYGSGGDPIASIAAYIKSGYAGGKWNGSGIFSSPAAGNAKYGIGYADGKDNVVAGLVSGQIEVKYTLLGDANLDGAVNGADFAILAANFNKAVSGWDQGDFDFSGTVNGADFALLAANFNQGSNGAVSAADAAAIAAFVGTNGLTADLPEPVSGAILASGVVAMMFRATNRRRRPV